MNFSKWLMRLTRELLNELKRKEVQTTKKRGKGWTTRKMCLGTKIKKVKGQGGVSWIIQRDSKNMLVAKKGWGILQTHQVTKTIIFNMEKTKEYALCASFFIRNNLFMYQSKERGNCFWVYLEKLDIFNSQTHPRVPEEQFHPDWKATVPNPWKI